MVQIMNTANAVPVITIDGPGGSGKGTIGLRLSRRKGWHFLDSGCLYRLVGLWMQKYKVDLADESQLVKISTHLPVTFLVADQTPSGYKIILDKQDVTKDIRTEEVAAMASKVAAIPSVRQALLNRQRAFRVAPGLVADGRDMGTVIFPDAIIKIYLTARAEVRANRRYKQLKEKGINANLSAILADIKERDERDKMRVIAPLVPANDAVVIDTSDLNVNETEQRVLDLVCACIV